MVMTWCIQCIISPRPGKRQSATVKSPKPFWKDGILSTWSGCTKTNRWGKNAGHCTFSLSMHLLPQTVTLHWEQFLIHINHTFKNIQRFQAIFPHLSQWTKCSHENTTFRHFFKHFPNLIHSLFLFLSSLWKSIRKSLPRSVWRRHKKRWHALGLTLFLQVATCCDTRSLHIGNNWGKKKNHVET